MGCRLATTRTSTRLWLSNIACRRPRAGRFRFYAERRARGVNPEYGMEASANATNAPGDAPGFGQGISKGCRFPAKEIVVIHAYRNRQSNGRHIGDALFALAWLIGALVVAGVIESFVGDSLLLLVISAPVLLLWMAPFYAHFFRRYYEIRLSDEGSCDFRGPLRSKQLRAQQI